MASIAILHNLPYYSRHSASFYRKETLRLHPSPFLSSKSDFSRLTKQSFLSTSQFQRLGSRKLHAVPVVSSLQSNFFKVVQTAWKVGKDGIETGTNLVPESVPRPVARVSVTAVAVSVGLFLLKSLLSTAFFVLAMMGLIYFTFLAVNKDDSSSGGGGGGSSPSTEDPLEEARRIMEKYK